MTMHWKILSIATLSIGLTLGSSVSAETKGPVVGEAAPTFTATDADGNQVSLSDFVGKPVVLEWSNHDCPYVRKHYESGNMQKTQRTLTEDGAVWLTIVSSAPGKQGHVSPSEAKELTTRRGAYPSKVLLDPEGVVGRSYLARTTPHMFIIDEKGVVQYQGAIDDRPSANPSSLKGATNFVTTAWAALKAGKPVENTNTTPYGCSVKY